MYYMNHKGLTNKAPPRIEQVTKRQFFKRKTAEKMLKSLKKQTKQARRKGLQIIPTEAEK